MKEYKILLNELKMYNPELLDKPRILAITKADLIDEELKQLLLPEIPKNIPSVFISSVAQIGLMELKDLLWETINKDINEVDLEENPDAKTSLDLGGES